MSWTDEEFNEFAQIMSGGNSNDIALHLRVISNDPTGDPRVIPILERLCADKRIVRVQIPIRYGEIAYLAAFALWAEKLACKLDGKIRITTAVVDPHDLTKLTERHGVTIPRGIGGILVAAQTLADMGKLPQMVLELDPTRYDGVKITLLESE